MRAECNDLSAMPHAPANDDTFRIALVAPTFDNASTLPAIVRDLRELDLPLIIVNDGCTDETPAILVSFAGDDAIQILNHARNRGKAAALRSGFAHAQAAGFTHALTIDTDGQHDVRDAAGLIELAKANPRALIVGCRAVDHADYPRRSRLGRKISNALVRLESGQRIDDSQCGLRVYPLAALSAAPVRSGRFGYETEILTRFAWANVPLIEMPIRCIYDPAGGRTTHFRPLRDSLAAIAMHGRLIARSCVPSRASAPGGESINPKIGTIAQRFWRWINPIPAWRAARESGVGHARLAAAMALGIAVATLPPLGYKTVLCLLLSRWLRLQPAVVIGTASLNTPPVGPLLAALSLVAGHFVLHGSAPMLPHDRPTVLLANLGAEYLLGTVLVGATLAAIMYGAARLALRAVCESASPATASMPSRQCT